jgi:rsbT co-antagonist protein RsbR
MSLNAALAYFDEHPQLALLLGPDGRILRASNRFRQFVGGSEGVALPDSFADLVDPAVRDAVQAAIDGIIEPESRVDISLSLAIGNSSQLSWSLVRSRDGQTVFATAVDMVQTDDGRLATNKFARENNILQHVIDNMPVVLWAIDEKGIFTLSDGAALATLGLQPGQVVGMDAFQLYAAESSIISAMRRALVGEFSCEMTSGGGLTWESRFIPRKSADGTVEGVIGFSLDATDRVVAEKELKQKVELVERQETAIRSLSTPIMRVWAGVLALPLVGMLDGTRIENILGALLEAVVHEQAEYVILDLTGIANVDGTTADHVFKVLRALALLGTQAVVTGVQPGVARALVEIGLDLGQVVTLGNLEEAIRFVMKQRTTKSLAPMQKNKTK